jgi:hypothetical protein
VVAGRDGSCGVVALAKTSAHIAAHIVAYIVMHFAFIGAIPKIAERFLDFIPGFPLRAFPHPYAICLRRRTMTYFGANPQRAASLHYTATFASNAAMGLRESPKINS